MASVTGFPSDGPVHFPGVPTRFSRTPGRVAGPAPELAPDTAEVLEELGLAPVDMKPARPL
jgi:crotonobetainyl-CoA:carnitine CoA-transferase CaiB-like acyl-CoA transferase